MRKLLSAMMGVMPAGWADTVGIAEVDGDPDGSTDGSFETEGVAEGRWLGNALVDGDVEGESVGQIDTEGLIEG